MVVEQIWRYPVKGLAGEPLAAATFGAAGVDGDRRHALLVRREGARPRKLTGQHRPELLGYAARARGDGPPVVVAPDGSERPWTDEGFQTALRERVGPFEPILDERGIFDDSPVLLLNRRSLDAYAAEYGAPLDARRYRMNLLCDLGEPWVEEGWVSRRLEVGEVLLRVESRCERCVFTTIDPDTHAKDPRILKLLASEHEACMGIYLSVLRPGVVCEGDALRLV